MKSRTCPNSLISTTPHGIRGRASARVATAPRSVWKAAISRSEKRVQMSPFVAYQARSGCGRWRAAYLRPPPRPSGSSSTTVVTRSGSRAPASQSWRTPARCPQETTASVTPSAASQASWCPMIGTPVPGISTIGFGRSSVYGRSRDPWPPARTTAWVGEVGNAAAGGADRGMSFMEAG